MGGYYPGDAFEVETLVCQAGAGYRPKSPFRSQAAQDAVILPQAVVYGAHQVVAVPVQAIVVGVSAGVRTEFLVGSSPVIGLAFQTTSFQGSDLFDLYPVSAQQAWQAFQGKARVAEPVLFRVERYPEGRGEIGLFQAGLKEYGPFQVALREDGCAEFGLGEIHLPQRAVFKMGPLHFKAAKGGKIQLAMLKPQVADKLPATLKAEPHHFAAPEADPTPLGPANVRIAQIAIVEITIHKVAAVEVTPRKIKALEGAGIVRAPLQLARR
jgi:hypothetical protein